MEPKTKPRAGRPGAGQKIDADGCPNDTTSPDQSQDISTFRGINQHPTGTTTWRKALVDIQSDKNRKAIENVRTVLHKFGCESAEYRGAKIELPAVTFGGTFTPHRAKVNIALPTGFIISDLDHLKDVELVFGLLAQDKNIWFAFRSPSGEGIKAGIRAQGIKNDDDHKKLYFAVERYFKEVYDLQIDPACKDISRLTFVSHDPELWISDDPQYFDISKWSSKPLPPLPPPVKPPALTNTTGKQKSARKVLKLCCEKIRQSPPGGQHRIRRDEARLIGGYLQYISESEVVSELEQAVIASGAQDLRAAMKTVRDGLAYGKLAPITIPQRPNGAHSKPSSPGQDEPQDDPGETDAELWGVAEKLFPRIEFPEILPSELDDSLRQLARSIGMPARSLPGICMSAIGAALGDRISVSPKQSWIEHLVFWFFDIRPSGEGKTPAMQALIKFFHQKQKIEHDYYDLKKAEFDGLSAKDRKDTIPPQKPRGYIGNTLTVEGLRTDLETNKTGGLLIALTEASALISGQNEYKSKGGTDREAWITSHDGDPIRILRASKSIYISNSRVSIIGGIQPGVFRKVFTSEDGIFLVDGTVFRGLFTYDQEQSFDIDAESWGEENEKVWTNIIEQAFSFSESQDTIKNQCLSSGARDLFFSWRNSLNRQKLSLPEKIQGFLPKAYGYALRIAGVLHCIHKFHEGLEPTGIITREDMQRGIDGIMFYLGQTVDVVRLLAGEDRVFVEITDQTIHLAKTLESLKPDLDSGRLAVGYIHEKFNKNCKPEQKIGSARAMGALLRNCKLTIPAGTFNANGKQSVKCLQWDKKTKSFIETCLQCLQCLRSESGQGLQGGDIDKRDVSNVSREGTCNSQVETLETLEKRRLQAENRASTDRGDIGDIGDEFSKEIKNNEFEDLGAGCSDCDEDIL